MSQTGSKESLIATHARDLVEAVHNEMTECICPGCILITALSETLKATMEYAPVADDDFIAALASVSYDAICKTARSESPMRSLLKLHTLLDLNVLLRGPPSNHSGDKNR